MIDLNEHQKIPHLTTASSEPLRFLEQLIIDKQIDIETWFRQQWQKTHAPITSSVDLRNAGFKLAPVDTNLFPAGFNNLNRALLPLAIQAIQSVIVDSMPDCTKILIVPENHTRNPFYLKSLATIVEIIEKAGFDTRIGSIDENISQKTTIDIDEDHQLVFEPLKRKNNRVYVDDFCPCLILLNNDLSAGVPEILQNIEQTIRPSSKLGWTSRFKSQHFEFYQQVCSEFATLLDIDSWLVTPQFSVCSNIDFMKREGEEYLADKANDLLQSIGQKYQANDIDSTPFVAIKADSGTYGMGVMMVDDARKLLHLNRKQRTKMSATKGSLKVNRVIIQEGVPTIETWDDAVAEPVIYMMGQYVIGGFYRVHKERGLNENLNAPGMHFESLAFADSCINPQPELPPEECPNRFYAYGVIARLGALAAAREIDQMEKTQ
jgi:glutamate--cysteine ligase